MGEVATGGLTHSSPHPVKTRASRHLSPAGASVLPHRNGTLAPVRYIPGFIPTITGKMLHGEGRGAYCKADAWWTRMTGLTPVTSPTDSSAPTTRMPPAVVEVGVNRPVRRTFGEQPCKSPSSDEEKKSPVWKGRGACGIPLRYKRRTLPI